MSVTETPQESAMNHMVELHIDQDPEGQVDSTIAVRWCIDPGLAAYLREHPGQQPWLVISDFPASNSNFSAEARRWVVPLDRLMTYISFSRPGKHILAAFVLLGPESTVKNWILSEYSRNSYEFYLYKTAFGDEDSKAFDDRLRRQTLERGQAVDMKVATRVTELDVVVPKELFAKEPPKWVRNYMNIFFKHRPEDQCHLRKRSAMFLLLPIILVGSIMIRIICMLWSLLAVGSCYPKYLFKPFSTNVAATSWKWPDIDDHWQMKPARTPALYLVVLPLAVLLLVILVINWRWTLFGMSIVIGFFGNMYLLKKLPKRKSKRADARSRKWVLEEEAYQALICQPSSNQAPSLSALPRHKRTVRLRFGQLKTKVCRPYAS